MTQLQLQQQQQDQQPENLLQSKSAVLNSLVFVCTFSLYELNCTLSLTLMPIVSSKSVFYKNLCKCFCYIPTSEISIIETMQHFLLFILRIFLWLLHRNRTNIQIASHLFAVLKTFCLFREVLTKKEITQVNVKCSLYCFHKQQLGIFHHLFDRQCTRVDLSWVYGALAQYGHFCAKKC